MKPTEGEWEKRYWDLMGEAALLEEMQADGHNVDAKWQSLFESMKAHGLHAMVNDIKRRLQKRETL
jgi:hypothetical protein